MTTRREFVAGTGAALAAVALAPGRAEALFRREKIERIGLELYTMRAEMAKDVAGTIARVARIGYKEVEFFTYNNWEPEKLRALIDAHGLTSPSVHTAIEILERDFDARAAAAKVMGHKVLIVPSLNTRTLTTAESWKEIAKRFNALGRKAHDAGLRFAFHNHAVEAAMLNGFRPYDILLGETDPALVDFQMDLYWMIKAGGDPIAYFNSNPGRFISVHVKDATAAPELAMRDVGAGAVDWRKIFAMRAKAGIKYFIVEHDEPRPDAFDSITASYNYLSRLTW
jgi:sugar phosphate isomerase/epimerase